MTKFILNIFCFVILILFYGVIGGKKGMNFLHNALDDLIVTLFVITIISLSINYIQYLVKRLSIEIKNRKAAHWAAFIFIKL